MFMPQCIPVYFMIRTCIDECISLFNYMKVEFVYTHLRTKLITRNYGMTLWMTVGQYLILENTFVTYSRQGTFPQVIFLEDVDVMRHNPMRPIMGCAANIVYFS